MDINDLRSLGTVTCFAALIGVFWWAWDPKRKKQFDDAAQLPFSKDSDESESANKKQHDGEHNR